MSEAPHLELSNPDLPDLDPSAPSNAHSYSNGSSNGTPAATSRMESTKNSIMETAQSAMASVNNHPTTQNLKNALTRAGPVAQNVKAETAKTRDEFADLANARQTPEQPAATGQPLTHYHSMFYRLLSWKNPRATAISFAVSVLFIFAARYLNVIRYIFKAVYMTLGATATAEIAGKLAFGRGFTSQFRPRKYFVIPKASLERLLDDVEQFINFFVIESQRILFAENVYATSAAFLASLVSYFLIKFVPLWGLTLIATTVAYLGPLVYIQNKEVIDTHLQKAGHMVNQQAVQIKDMAAQHTGNAAKTFQSYAGEYTHKAQETINQYRGRSASPEVKREDFPRAPAHEPTTEKSGPILEPAT
ncbi:Reticulon-domain-containing protein [Clohesyomyces aquaticus]|uniref:Reticulon-like protein n=1 Tax=Clohesyomyces aquaticus TaxID=1231657 RepID=A0A1Y1YEF0_9PLEO|nr:Reticulon-domain-containing protein [Clohesyomyces aquaticus]